jgi:hypothetical protein
MGVELETIEALLRQHLPVRKKEKESFGEVFTPSAVIQDLLNQFPANVWKQKTFKWLDPASGIGNFPIYIFFNLMNGLKSELPNETKRAKHIVEHMLYFVELNPENVKKTREIFQDLAPGATLNIFEGSFLDFSSQAGNDWPTKFQCIVGNPPYNSGGIKREGEKRIHVAFTKKAIQHLDSDGYLAFVCPPNYRETGSTMNKLFLENPGHFLYIHVYGADETHRLFRIQARVDAFLFQLGKKGKTAILDEYKIQSNNITLDLTKHVPNFGYSIYDKILKKVDQYGHLKGFRTTQMTTVHKDKFQCGPHKIIHLITTNGRRIFKVKEKHKLEGTPKAVINGLGLPYVYYDEDGSYGVTQTPVVIERPTARQVDFLESELFVFLAWALRITGNNNMPYILDAVPALPEKGAGLGSLEKLADFFGLTEKELDFIEDNFPVPPGKDADLVEGSCGSKLKKTRRNRN